MVSQEFKAKQDLEVYRGQKGLKVTTAPREHRESEGKPARKGSRENRALKGRMGALACRGRLGRWDQMGSREKLDYLVIL